MIIASHFKCTCVVNLDNDGGAGDMSDGDVWRETREGSLLVDCKKRYNIIIEMYNRSSLVRMGHLHIVMYLLLK